MHIVEITSRHRNDFHFKAQCRHCKRLSTWGDGYADAYYQENVFPARHCPHCGKDEAGNLIDIAKQIETLGADSLLPDWKP